MTTPSEPDDLPVVLIIGLAALLGAAGYFLYLFASALIGLVRQLGNPAAAYESNATLLVATYPAFIVLAYAFLPELPNRRERLRIATKIAVVPTILLPLTCGFLLPGMASPAPWPFAATLFLVFFGTGVLPTLALARLRVLASTELRCAALGDVYIDADLLTGDTRRIIAKQTNGTFRRPAALHRPVLLGDGGRLTQQDVIHLIDLETNELDRLAARADAETRRVIAEFRQKRAELLAATAPELTLRLTERANSTVFSPEEEQ